LEDAGAPGNLGETEAERASDGVDFEGLNPEDDAATVTDAGPAAPTARTRGSRASRVDHPAPT